MKKMQLKDALRNIRKERVSFISIIFIAMLSVTAFLGINYGSTALFESVERYYGELNFRDYEIVSTMLLTEDDLDAYRRIPGVSDVEGVCKVSGSVRANGYFRNVFVSSVPERVNLLRLTEGRMPEKIGECVMETSLLDYFELRVGDTFTVKNETGDSPRYLTTGTFTITGIVQAAEAYTRLKQVQPQERGIYVPQETFDLAALDGCYTHAELTLQKNFAEGFHDAKYTALVDAMTPQIEAVGAERAAMREKALADEIAKGEAELSEAKEKLSDGEKQLLDGEKQYEAGKKELEDGKKTLDEAAEKLKKGEEELASGKKTLDEKGKELENGKATLDAGKAQLSEAALQLTDSFETIERVKTMARDVLMVSVEKLFGEDAANSIAWASPVETVNLEDRSISASKFAVTENVTIDFSKSIADLIGDSAREAIKNTGFADRLDDLIEEIKSTETYAKIESGYESVFSKLGEWDSGRDQYLDGLAQYRSGLSQYEAGAKLYAEGVAQYEAYVAEYEEGKKAYEEGLEKYEKGLKELEEGRKKLDDGYAEYGDGVRKILEGEEKLDEAKEQFEALSPCKHVLLGASSNPSYVHGVNAAENIRKLGVSFASLFIVIGALVIYVTVGRIIGEQRKLVGTQKALGLYTREIFGKYLVFGLLSTVIGALLGILVAYFFVQWIMLHAHGKFYVVGEIPRSIDPLLTVLVVAGAAVLAFAAVWLACRKLLKDSAKNLMQEKLPATKNRNRSGNRASSGSLYGRLILRNMRNEIGRVIVTIFSILGVTALLMIGFTIQGGVQRAIDRQFQRIAHMDASVKFNGELNENARTEMEQIFEESSIEYVPVFSVYRMFDGNDRKAAIEVIAAEPERFASMISLFDGNTRKEAELPAEGVVVTQRVAETYNFKEGDPIVLYDSLLNPHESRIALIMENYFGLNLYMTFDAYRACFGVDQQPNVFYLKGIDDLEALTRRIESIDGYESIEDYRAVYESYSWFVSLLTLLTVVLTVTAGLMAYFVLLNLFTMYYNQKKREITIMRVNGFTTRECIQYISRESVITTVLGIVLGIVVGALIGNVILEQLQQAQARFVYEIYWQGILFSALISGVYSLLINALVMRKVKDLKLRDIA